MTKSIDYIVSLDNFNGPLDLLLRLIERDKLDICEVSIAKITEDYLSYVKNIELSHHDANKFLEVAVKLILTKSRALLPNRSADESEEDLEDLSDQLLELQSYKNLAKKFTLMQDHCFIDRPKITSDYSLVSYSNVNLENIVNTYNQIRNGKDGARQFNLSSLKRKTSTKKRQMLIDKLLELNKFSVSTIPEITNNNKESVMMFMIVLEFIKLNKLRISNPSALEIEVMK